MSIRVLHETHDTPEWAEQYMARIGGKNRFGEPNLRIAWSNSCLGWIGGKFEERDAESNLIREVFKLEWMPKYPIENRWLIEQWIAPEKFGTPESWMAKTKDYTEEGNIPQLGPFPFRGRYQLCCVLEENGQFLQLTYDVLEDVATAFRIKNEMRRALERSDLAKKSALNDDKAAIQKQREGKIAQDAEWIKEEMRSDIFLKGAVTVL
jgi:hypothetical protein